MKTEWNYTTLADAYLKRPDYAANAIDAMLSIVKAKNGSKVCDIGAGVAHLTLMLAKHDLDVTAVEPNDAMRTNGIKRTENFENVCWHEGTGEHTGQANQAFDIVTFGSSFNVCNRLLALKETSRILKPRGWFACLWNHRELDDPIQLGVEKIIKEQIPNYGYGIRREDQTPIINSSNLFGSILHLDARITYEQSIDECVEAWKSHATLQRQSGELFSNILNKIESYFFGLGQATVNIPYVTNIWLAQLK